MFGLGILGGLMGGGGLLGHLGGGGGGGQSHIPTYSGQASHAEHSIPEPQESSGPTHSARPQEAPTQEAPEHPMVSHESQQIAAGNPRGMQQNRMSPIHGLLDQPSPQPTPEQATEDQIQRPPNVENHGFALSPVAPQQEQQTGFIPHALQTDSLPNRLFDAGSNREVFEFQPGMQPKEVDLGSQSTPPMGYQYSQPTTVSGSAGSPRYRSI
jgi:hypothetical protein